MGIDRALLAGAGSAEVAAGRLSLLLVPAHDGPNVTDLRLVRDRRREDGAEKPAATTHSS
jgi:hypothetical protein